MDKILTFLYLLAIVVVFLLITFLFAVYVHTAHADVDNQQIELLADAIKIAENSEKYPYGVKSINTHGDEKAARQICINSIVNNYERWDKTGDFITFMGKRYCPPSAHPLNNHWVKNVKYHYKGKEIK